jgi:DNA-binding beta-propeller fold protein YncE
MASARAVRRSFVPLCSLAAASVLLLSASTARAASAGDKKAVTASAATFGGDPDGVAFDPATHTLYTVDEAGSISVVDTRQCNAEAIRGCSAERVGTVSLPPGSDPRSIAVDVATDTAYVADTETDEISVINGATCDATERAGCTQTAAPLDDPSDHSVETVTSVHLGIPPDGIAVDPATDTVYVTSQDANDPGHLGHTVAVIDGATCNGRRSAGCRHIATVDIGRGPARIGASPPTFTIAREMHIGAPPMGVAVDSANHTVYAVNQGSGTVAVVDVAACEANDDTGCARTTATIRVGADPVGVSLDEAASTVYVGGNGGATLSVIDTARCNATDRAGCARTPTTITVGRNPFGPGIDRATFRSAPHAL